MAGREKKIKFETKVTGFGKSFNWYYLPVTAEHAEKFGFEGKSRRVVCTLNSTETFQCALMPMEGAFFIIINKKIRTKLLIGSGDSVSVELVKDTSKYGLPMPEEFREVLDQDPDGDRLFHALTAGAQRSMLYFLGKIKDIDKRIHSALIYIEHLKDNDGKIVHEKLRNELKRPINW